MEGNLYLQGQESGQAVNRGERVEGCQGNTRSWGNNNAPRRYSYIQTALIKTHDYGSGAARLKTCIGAHHAVLPYYTTYCVRNKLRTEVFPLCSPAGARFSLILKQRFLYVLLYSYRQIMSLFLFIHIFTITTK